MKRLCVLLCLTVALLCWSPSRHVQCSEQPSSLPELAARDSNPHTTQENGADDKTKAIQMLQSQLESITNLMLNLSVTVSQLHREVLLVRYGNSELSERLYDVGYRHLTNIDISETVVAHMNQRNVQRRPDLTFHRVDATQTGYESSSFQACLDKGTLDAMASEEEGVVAGKMLAEVGRVLAVGGRYVCVTLAQEHVIKLAVEHFVEAGFAVRIHSLSQQNLDWDSSSFALPVFVLICTKFRQPSPFKVLEMCQGEDGTPCRLGSVPELLAAVKERQAYALMLQKLRGATDTASTPSLTLCHAATGRPRYTLTVQDSPTSAKVPRANHFAIFIGRHSYDVIIFDVDSKDRSLGMSCPLPAFVETPLLEKVHKLLTPRGVFMLNLVCRDSALRQSVLERLQALFPSVLSRPIEGEVNEVLLCSQTKHHPAGATAGC